MRIKYEEQLKTLHEELVRMGGMCEQAIALAVQALNDRQMSLLDKAEEIDRGIDKMEREIESLCLRILLQQQPVAADLRTISAALKMISDVERIGDQATDIAEIGRHLLSQKQQETGHIPTMAAEAIQMVNNSIDAFVQQDLTLARQVIDYDDVVDNWFDTIRQELIQRVVAAPEEGERCIDLLMVAKYLERIADHATNIAEWAEYAITGKRSKDGVIPE